MKWCHLQIAFGLLQRLAGLLPPLCHVLAECLEKFPRLGVLIHQVLFDGGSLLRPAVMSVPGNTCGGEDSQESEQERYLPNPLSWFRPVCLARDWSFRARLAGGFGRISKSSSSSSGMIWGFEVWRAREVEGP